MNKFLQDSRTSLGEVAGTTRRVHAVLANEACDLDSAACTLVQAYLSHAMSPPGGALVLPILNITPEEYPLRTEVAFFLHKLGIAKDHLIFRPEVDLHQLHRAGRLLVTLVDRHTLEGADSQLESAVVQVIDHHEPERPLSDDVTIERVGSCCTLVAEKLFSVNRNLIDSTVADLLLGAILLDTVNLSEAARRVTPKDRMMASFLEPLTSGYSQNQLFDMLQRARGDVSHLSSFQLLRKDTKTVDTGGLRIVFSSVPMLVKDYVHAPDAVSACNQLCQTGGYDLVVLMGSQVSGADFHRDIGVFSVSGEHRQKVCSVLEDSVSPCLSLSPITSPHPRLALYRQGNVAASRKAVLPLVRGALTDPGGSGELSPVGRVSRPAPILTYTTPRLGELPHDLRSPNGIDLNLSAQAVALLTEPTSTGGSSQSSAYNSVPYTPQNSVADSDSIADITPLPSFNSRDLLQRIEVRRGPLGGFEGADDVQAYPFTPKNSFVESSLDTTYRQMTLSELDSEMILQKVHEKKRKSNLFDDITEEEDGSGAAGGGDGNDR